MAVTLLPVSAITAWAEEGGSTLKPLQFKRGLPVLDDITPTPSPDGHIYTGDGWSYESFDAEISYFGSSGYVIPNSDHDTSITIYIFLKNSQAILFPIDVTFGDTNGTPCLLKDWAPSANYSTDHAPSDSFFVTFTAPSTGTDTVTLSMLTRLVIDENGYPVGTEGGTRDYSGDGWKFENGTLTLESGRYDFSGEENALGPLNPNVHLVVESGAKLTGGAVQKRAHR